MSCASSSDDQVEDPDIGGQRSFWIHTAPRDFLHPGEIIGVHVIRRGGEYALDRAVAVVQHEAGRRIHEDACIATMPEWDAENPGREFVAAPTASATGTARRVSQANVGRIPAAISTPSRRYRTYPGSDINSAPVRRDKEFAQLPIKRACEEPASRTIKKDETLSIG